ncbi:MAG: Superoxide dismutase [Candidatus Woesebacteria bacterium GW2011_GWB1_43_14]|uniref:Superoxide dismutase n=1 Tax=Candidatus Woesebacteria bacterium GW2011_GWB1_43_14 TaxID=1618578 RepID=A0A0G1FQL0_9BACT|nr:MAG: Superoxide dismutase [Candidatus Woesebacteria bacterium GW2011_GWB1_43_14]
MHKLPDLPYPFDALEPYIDKKTMELHHGKHHAGYVEKLNLALENNKELLEKDIEGILRDIKSVPEEIRQTVVNSGGGHANHSFFWKIMGPKPKAGPEGKLFEALKSEFGSFDNFQEKFTEKALGVFGAGWAFLIINKDNKLELTRQSFQNSPLLYGNMPILGIDVWEH